MKIATVVIGILVVMLIPDNVQGKLVTKPTDGKAEIGHYVIMNCSSDYVNDTCGKISWRYFKINSSSEDYKSISTDGKLIPEVTSYISIIDSRAGNCNLRIKATPSAAGNYQCLDATPDFAHALMTVLEVSSDGCGIGIDIGLVFFVIFAYGVIKKGLYI